MLFGIEDCLLFSISVALGKDMPMDLQIAKSSLFIEPSCTWDWSHSLDINVFKLLQKNEGKDGTFIFLKKNPQHSIWMLQLPLPNRPGQFLTSCYSKHEDACMYVYPLIDKCSIHCNWQLLKYTFLGRISKENKESNRNVRIKDVFVKPSFQFYI